MSIGYYGDDKPQILQPGKVLTVESGLYIVPDTKLAEVKRVVTSASIRFEQTIVESTPPESENRPLLLQSTPVATAV
ncbi:MAG: hypothetical protein HC862_19240 [Scytonema sp. RU_4_4]|nr:hypothetical protein [Scytonema sp. RU_4_4]